MDEHKQVKNGIWTNVWTVKRWQAIITLGLLIASILGQLLFAQGWKVNLERDIKERPTVEETRRMIEKELLIYKEDIREIKLDIKNLIRNKKE